MIRADMATLITLVFTDAAPRSPPWVSSTSSPPRFIDATFNCVFRIDTERRPPATKALHLVPGQLLSGQSRPMTGPTLRAGVAHKRLTCRLTNSSPRDRRGARRSSKVQVDGAADPAQGPSAVAKSHRQLAAREDRWARLPIPTGAGLGEWPKFGKATTAERRSISRRWSQVRRQRGYPPNLGRTTKRPARGLAPRFVHARAPEVLHRCPTWPSARCVVHGVGGAGDLTDGLRAINAPPIHHLINRPVPPGRLHFGGMRMPPSTLNRLGVHVSCLVMHSTHHRRQLVPASRVVAGTANRPFCRFFC